MTYHKEDVLVRPATTRRAAAARALYATLIALVLAGAAQAQSGGAPVSRAPAAGPASGEDDRYFRLAGVLRERVLGQAQWVEFGSGECREGALRVFSTDSASAQNSNVTELIAHLERIVIARGAEARLDSAPVVELLSTVIGWESGITRPKWDVRAGQEAPEAIAAGLTGEYMNPVTSKCELLAPFDTMRVVLPEGASVPRPVARSPVVLVESGPEGLNRLRDAFFALTSDNPEAVMTYTSVIAIAEWRGFGVVAVNRPAELRGALLHRKTAGGAAYLFHRENGEWRLLAITRTW
jgi:hypothetical protein